MSASSLPNDRVAPVRVGMDRNTGKIKIGWLHVQQSLDILFQTRFHERILRQWVGSFVPHLLGQNITEPTVGRFWWAIISAVDLWEPDYSINRIYLATGLQNPTTAETVRVGDISMQYEGTYKPRGHLGDPTPETTRSAALTNSAGQWLNV